MNTAYIGPIPFMKENHQTFRGEIRIEEGETGNMDLGLYGFHTGILFAGAELSAKEVVELRNALNDWLRDNESE